MEREGKDPQGKIIDVFRIIFLDSQQPDRNEDLARCRDDNNFMAGAGIGMIDILADPGIDQRQPDQDFNNRKKGSIIAHASKL